MVLSILVLFLYQALFIKPSSPTQPVTSPVQEEKLAESAASEKEKTGEAKIIFEPARLFESAPGAIMADQEQEVVVETPLFTARWSNRGGVLKSWQLKRHLDEKNQALELVSPLAQEWGIFPFSLQIADESLEKIANGAYYQVSTTSLRLEGGETGEIKFDYSDGKSILISKRFLFRGDAYEFTTDISVGQEGKAVDFSVIWGPGFGLHYFQPGMKTALGQSGVAFYLPPKVWRVQEKKLEEKFEMSSLTWAAYEDNYTAALFLFPAAKGRAIFFKMAKQEGEGGGGAPGFFLATSSPRLVMIGPKEIDGLKALGHDAKKLINFGFFGAIVELLLLGLKAFHRLIPNWGIAIIIMTLIIKIIFFPLTYSSTKSMAKMQELQPKIKALQAKYKKAKRDIEERRKMNEEMMKLYKEHGINPAAGCLPILIQFPVFIAFYRLLVIAVELRRSPFILWIKDATRITSCLSSWE